MKFEYKSITDDEPPDIHFCQLKNTHCIHADIINNKEIGYTICTGEYCTTELKFKKI